MSRFWAGAPGVAFTPGVLRVAAQVVSSVTETPGLFLRTRLGRDGIGRSRVKTSNPQFSTAPAVSSRHLFLRTLVSPLACPPQEGHSPLVTVFPPLPFRRFSTAPSKYLFGISSTCAVIILDIPLKAAFSPALFSRGLGARPSLACRAVCWRATRHMPVRRAGRLPMPFLILTGHSTLATGHRLALSAVDGSLPLLTPLFLTLTRRRSATPFKSHSCAFPGGGGYLPRSSLFPFLPHSIAFIREDNQNECSSRRLHSSSQPCKRAALQAP